MPTSYQPSAYFFRKSLREAATKEEAVEVGMVVILELETLKEWVRAQGLRPPKTHIHPSEAEAKGWGKEP
jgi:hypothetical protein